eukprot:TRINITY_DN3894_c0_g1_i1.p1 TRINITY_DN3894_c0_g1~~TRINITY_DN3894_c0_g1_i1.p1  ORF type:complete len:355 (-),score=47.76 TRINITY_DN3894_c0_g1_i1:326-1390(-)
MNCCQNTTPVDPKTAAANDAINKDLQRQRRNYRHEIKLLLLGAGESGKSTIAKQMKIIHKNGFTVDELTEFANTVHHNVYHCCHTLIQASKDLGIPLSDPSLATNFASPFLPEGKLTPELGAQIKKLWLDEGIISVYARRAEFQLLDSTDYFLNDIERVSSRDYFPTEQDVLRSRVQTRGITETSFTFGGVPFLLVDVGGQRSERKKWMYCFEDVVAILFVVALSEFDLTLFEDRKTNRMKESLILFQELCLSKWFMKAGVILFLNKCDIFRQKLKEGKSIKVAFSDYKGDNSYSDALQFIQDRFMDVCDPLTNKPKLIYPHVTCATDTDNVKHVFNDVKDYLLSSSINSSSTL